MIDTSNDATSNAKAIEEEAAKAIEEEVAKAAEEEDVNVKITMLDKREEYVVIENQGNAAVDIGRWTLISEKGADQGQTYTFPSSFILEAGESITLIAGKDPVAGYGEIIMATKNIWNNSEPDPAILIDASRVDVDRLE